LPSLAGLLIAWFQSLRNGDRQPHSPQVCLPGAGWTSEATGEVRLVSTAGPITVNRYTIDSRRDGAVVLYWYQTPRRVIAGEWAAKFWLLPDAIHDGRTDTALIRVVDSLQVCDGAISGIKGKDALIVGPHHPWPSVAQFKLRGTPPFQCPAGTGYQKSFPGSNSDFKFS
jgi:hypothetical protein